MSEPLYPIAVEVNGAQRTGHVSARTSLVDWLREHLDLTGTHIGCEHGICGACSVALGDERADERLTVRPHHCLCEWMLRGLLGKAGWGSGPVLSDVCGAGERPP